MTSSAGETQVYFRIPAVDLEDARAAIQRSGLPPHIWYRIVLLSAAGRPDLAAAVRKEHRENERARAERKR